MNSNKIKWTVISLFGLLVLGLVTYSTIHYIYYPLPIDSEHQESLVDSVFNDYFNDKKEVIINNEPKYWWEVIGSESKLMKDFYNDLRTKAKYYFDSVKITYNSEPKLDIENNKIYLDFKLNITNLNKDWIYNDFINYKIAKNPT